MLTDKVLINHTAYKCNIKHYTQKDKNVFKYLLQISTTLKESFNRMCKKRYDYTRAERLARIK
ncbi:hypothetical protein BK708_02145 [Bacillus thuringiensis serovar yunnanensis]|nr:hypothetical protein BK708_02145 [Bacillus thuringiensis serovar yunnanensis]